jgi:hypothetical protein
MATLPALILGSVQKLIGMKVAVVSPETELQAREYLASIRKELKAFKTSVVEVKKPFKKEIDEIDAASKPWIEKLQQKDQETEQAILAYLRKVREETEKQNQKALEKYEKKVATVEAKAIANNKPMPIIIPPALASAPAKTVEIEGAKQTVVKRKAWRMRLAGSEVADPSAVTAKVSEEFQTGIPLEYFTLDTARIGKVVRAGGTIPGIEVYEEESLSQRAI